MPKFWSVPTWSIISSSLSKQYCAILQSKNVSQAVFRKSYELTKEVESAPSYFCVKSNNCLIRISLYRNAIYRKWRVSRKTEPDAVLEKKKEKYLESLQRRRLTPHIVAYTDQTNAKIQNLCVIVAKCFRQETGAKRSLYIFVSY